MVNSYILFSFPALNNDLGGCSFEQEGENFFIVGADAVRKKLGSQISPAYDTDINHNVTARNIAGWEIDQKRCILIFAYIPYYHYLADPILEDGTVTELQIKDEACSYIDINSSIKLRFCFYYCESNQDKIKFTAGGVTNNAVTSHWSRVYIIKL